MLSVKQAVLSFLRERLVEAEFHDECSLQTESLRRIVGFVEGLPERDMMFTLLAAAGPVMWWRSFPKWIGSRAKRHAQAPAADHTTHAARWFAWWCFTCRRVVDKRWQGHLLAKAEREKVKVTEFNEGIVDVAPSYGRGAPA